MKKLENKIIDKVYRFETKKTVLEILVRICSVIGISVFVVFIGQSIYLLLMQQETLDLLDLFQEDFEIIKNYFFDTAITFFDELPKFQLTIFIIGFMLLFLLILKLILNFSKIKLKTQSLVTYWRLRKR